MDRTIYSFPITVKASKSMNTNAFVKIVPVRACKDAMEWQQGNLEMTIGNLILWLFTSNVSICFYFKVLQFLVFFYYISIVRRWLQLFCDLFVLVLGIYFLLRMAFHGMHIFRVKIIKETNAYLNRSSGRQMNWHPIDRLEVFESPNNKKKTSKICDVATIVDDSKSPMNSLPNEFRRISRLIHFYLYFHWNKVIFPLTFLILLCWLF